MTKHVREQVLEYVKDLLIEKTKILNCQVHRIGPGQAHQPEHIEVYIDGETTGGSNSDDEIEDMLGTSVRVAALGVRITVKAGYDEHPDTRANEILALVEAALFGPDKNGDHTINDAYVSIQWAGVVNDYEDELENEMTQLEVAYQTSYRTPVGDSLTLI